MLNEIKGLEERLAVAATQSLQKDFKTTAEVKYDGIHEGDHCYGVYLPIDGEWELETSIQFPECTTYVTAIAKLTRLVHEYKVATMEE